MRFGRVLIQKIDLYISIGLGFRRQWEFTHANYYSFQIKESMNAQEDETENSNSRKNYTSGDNSRIHKQLSLLNELKDSQRWNLSSARLGKEELELIFKKLTDPKQLKYLWLHWNRLESMCKLVVQPSYSKLQIVNLGGNNLVSVEPLRSAKMESLQQLWLWSNNLTRVDSLRKIYAPNLKNLDLSSNHIVEMPRFSEFTSIKLQMVNIQRNKMSSIDNFAKNINLKANCMINFFDNQLVTVFGKIVNKKKKRGKVYHFDKEKIEYV